MKPEDAARALGPPGRLSRFEKEAIFARVHAGRVSWFRRRRVQLAASVFAAAMVAAVALVVVIPTSREAEYTARGAESSTLVIRCGERDAADCRVGDRIVFDFGSKHPDLYVSLFARSEQGTVIWYLPSEEAMPSIALATNATAGVLDTVAVIDDTYVPGRYELFAVMSNRPLSRAEIRSFADSDRLVAPPGVDITTRAFVVRGEEPIR